MRFEILNTSLSVEEVIDADNYMVTITIFLTDTKGLIPDFQKGVDVISNNSMTGFEVDAQREEAIQNLLKEVNGIS